MSVEKLDRIAAALPEREGSPSPASGVLVDLDAVQRAAVEFRTEYEARMKALDRIEILAVVFGVSLAAGSLLAWWAECRMAERQEVVVAGESLPDSKIPWWDNESEGVYSEDPENGYPYDVGVKVQE